MKQNILYKIILFFTIFNLQILADATFTGTTKTAYFLDSKVSGVHYQCNNGTLKTTGTDGNFTYDNTCSTITFSLNNKVILGTILVANIPADEKLYITNLAGTSRIDTSTPYVKNLARLLQSLDSDENPKNGIDINSSKITSSLTISSSTNDIDLQNIVNQQYGSAIPNRTLISANCALVHLEEVLRDDGFYVDTVPPCKPRLALDINATSNDKSYIELIGERNSKIYLNGVDTNLTLDSDGRYYDFELNTPIKRGTFDDFLITLKDNHTTPRESEALNLHILNDTDQPLITNILESNTTITVSTGATQVIDLNTTDDSITYGLPVSYEILGADKNLFTIIDTEIISTNPVKFQIWKLSLKETTDKRPLNIQIKVKDKANHYDIKSINVLAP